jgi:predicted nucleotidyltransferase
MQIRDHHQQAIDNLANAYREDPRFLALIIGGSVAKGFARPDSDVDFMMIATDEEYEQRLAARDLFINRQDLCDYAGGYVDGKIIKLDFLSEVADQGNEPSRAAFEGAFIGFTHIADLDRLLGKIPVYPEAGHDQRIMAFYCMAFMQHWLMHEAQRHGNRYAISRAASQLALFAGRLILAHNRRLFPFHKWLPRTLELVDDKPEGFLQHFNKLLESPGSDTATALFENVRDFQDWGISDLDAYTWFMTEVEWSWKTDSVPMEDW